ncbi:hypothetical protein NUBL17186_07290 [Klebsiella quasipneumoniae]|nr:hypothetical protein EXU08_17065 [Klebsiella quasipneumoniae subsp. similipneumoniae]GKO78793.1 hypothetical protein NUBL17186_07290 [Klebsiella quasipneumoniae]TBP21069.1 hypothetical protein EXU17_12495 [Klebsiella quasipneumoniae subsp. similipneumoniae]TBP37846.1 hypothetical protein EXU04_15100 [Klebsiella quasipneumoniae subsp. similipneumoniae]TBP56879.1 hypothetical protein EXU01_18625 [Klebsiella quasipneumoniae subsp. similipneumoniae]
MKSPTAMCWPAPVTRRAIWFSPEVKIPGGATAYRGYSAVRFGSPEKAQCAASGKTPGDNKLSGDMR